MNIFERAIEYVMKRTKYTELDNNKNGIQKKMAAYIEDLNCEKRTNQDRQNTCQEFNDIGRRGKGMPNAE